LTERLRLNLLFECAKRLLELSTAYLTLLENDTASHITSEELKNIIGNSMSKVGDSLLARIPGLSVPRENM